MPTRILCFVGCCAIALVAVIGVCAAPDVRLVQAAKGRNSAAVRALLNQKSDVNARDADGTTALHWAVRWDDLETAALLIRAGANPDAPNEYGITPLFLACTNRSAPMVAKLLAAGAQPNAASASGETPFMTCARTGNPHAVTAFLQRGVTNVNVTEPNRGQTALMWAIAEGHADVARMLLAHGAEVNARTKAHPLFVHFGGDGVDDGEIQIGGFTPILFAARQGSIETTRALLAAGARVNDTAPDGSSVLVVAAHSGHGKLASFLLENGADPNADAAGYTALHVAVLKSDLDLVKALLAHGANPNARLTKGTPVPRETNHYVLGRYLAGATPFFLAAKFAEAEIMRTLALGGADPSVTIDDGTTALMVAAGMTWLDGSQAMDRRDRAISVELHKALMADEAATLAAVKLAVDLGVDVRAANEDGDTALHAATRKGFGAIVDFLTQHGASLDVKNKRGQTPKDQLCFDGAQVMRCAPGARSVRR
jgi:ankyrin repeat protein